MRAAVVALAALGALAACGGGDAAPVTPPPPGGTPGTGIPTPGTPATGATGAPMAVLGQGVVTARYTGELSVRGEWAYTSTWGRRSASGNVVYVWNVAGAQPVLRDTLVIDGVGTTGDVQVSDDGALLAVATEPSPAGALVLYSLADPGRPRLVTRYTSPNLAPGVHTAELARVGGRLYAFCAVDPRGSAVPAKLVILDLADPAAPREVWAREMGQPFVHDVFVRDGVLFTANWHEGLVVWDVGGAGRGGSVAAPVRLGAVVTAASDPRSGASVHNVWWLHVDGRKRFVLVGEELTTGATVGNSSAGDVHVVDVGDLSQPSAWREVAFYNVPRAGTHNFAVDEARGIAYAAYYNGGVRALDVRGDLSACAAAERVPDGRCDLRRMGREIGVALAGAPTTTDPRTNTALAPYVWGVDLAGGRVYASDMMGGLWVLQPPAR